MNFITREIEDLVNRSADKQIRLAVTGLSRAGKTAFITSVVNQLLHSSTSDNMPLFQAARDNQLIGAKRVPLTNMLVPQFAYDQAIATLSASAPNWPAQTRDVSEIRLALRYKNQKRLRKLISETSTLFIDIVDYPGEWLLDLPLLTLSYEQWSEKQFQSLTGIRKTLAQPWLNDLQQIKLSGEANEKQIANIAERYTEFLHRCKDEGLHWVQPGRFVLPGELAGAPVLQFFPSLPPEKETGHKQKNTQYALLKARYGEYQNKVVKQFYKKYFATFDRQIVLVDCLSPLNRGHESFQDMKQALAQIMKSFEYGKSSFLRRLFAPKIDKILFVATKADHVTSEQHSHMVSLLKQMVEPIWQQIAYDNISMSCMSLASIQATEEGYVNNGENRLPVLRGNDSQNQPLTLYPGEVPILLPQPDYWEKNGFDFVSFLPKSSIPDRPLEHIRVDKALQYLIGDKLK